MNAFKCPQCGWSGYPSFNLHPRSNQLRAVCSNSECNYIDDMLGPNDFATGVVVTKDEAGRKHTERVALSERSAERPPERVERIAAAVMPVARSAISPQDVVSLARARLGELELEIARLEGLKAERNQLRRMVQAAERAPRRHTTPVLAETVEQLLPRLEN